MYHVPLAFQCIYGYSDEGSESGIGKEGSEIPGERSEWRLPDLLYTYDLVLCGESGEDLWAMVGSFDKVCRRGLIKMCTRRGLKVNAGKSKVMVQNGEEGLKYEVYVDGIHLDHVSKFKYLGCGLDESVCSRNVVSGRKIAGAIRSLVNARDLQLECTRVLHETLPTPIPMYGSEIML